MGLLSSASSEKNALKLQVEKMKKGKTPEQKQVIDFFFDMGKDGCGCGGCLSKKEETMTIDQYLALVQRMCDSLNLRQKAIEKIGLDESEIQEIEPIALSSFYYDDDALIKIENSLAVSSQYAVTWIFFSATQMYTYKFIFDTSSDNTWEFTNDFFYTDITCLSTRREVREKIDTYLLKGCFSSGEDFVKNNYVVDTFEIVVPGTSYKFSMRNGEHFERSIQAAKSMLREKKFTK